MLRILKIALVKAVAAWGVIGALGDVMDWKGTLGPVAAVVSMSTFPGGAARWQATTSPLVVLAGAVFILVFKVACALLCGAGAWRMWRARSADAEAFDRSKTLALAGCAVAVLGLFVGWIVIGEGWYEMWRSDALLQAGNGAFRYGGFIALIALMVGARDTERV